MKITASDRQKIFAYYGSQMSVSEITRELNKGRDKKLQFSRQAVSKILNDFKSGESCGKVAESCTDIAYKEVARTTYDKAVQELARKMEKATVQDILKTIEFYEKIYHFSEDQNDSNVTEIEVKVVDGTGNDETSS